MNHILSINRDQYLREKIGLKIPDTYNKISSDEKRKIIDKLISKIKRNKNHDKEMVALILIFEATIKSVYTKYVSVLSNKHGYGSDEYMSYLIAEFYNLTKNEFIQKNSKGFKANFNHFIHRKLMGRAYCLLSKENIQYKYLNEVYPKFAPTYYDDNHDTKHVDSSINDSQIQNLNTYFNKYMYHSESFSKYEYDEDEIDFFNIYKMHVNGCTNLDIAGTFKFTSSRISKILKGIKFELDGFKRYYQEKFMNKRIYID